MHGNRQEYQLRYCKNLSLPFTSRNGLLIYSYKLVNKVELYADDVAYCIHRYHKWKTVTYVSY